MSYALLNSLRRSRSFRLAGVFIMLFLLSTIAVGLFVYSTMASYLERQASSYLGSLMLEAMDHANEAGVDSLLEEITERTNLNRTTRVIYVLFDKNCIPIAGEPDRLPSTIMAPDFCSKLLAMGGRQIVNIPHRHSPSVQYPGRQPAENRTIEAIIRMQELPGGQSLAIILVVPEIVETRRFVSRIVVWSAAVIFVIGVLGAGLLARLVVVKLERINELSLKIRKGDLALRIPVDNSGDEFDDLAVNLNTMLDRIESLLEASRQVSNDIAHDLRTPLTRMRTSLEKLELNSLDEKARRELIDHIIDESNVLLGMFNSLLRIAGIESEGPGKEFSNEDVSEILEDVTELLEPLASESEVDFRTDIQPGIEITCDRNLLFQAFANIIENAIKYTPAGGRIDIQLTSDSNGSHLVVRDSGPGIPTHLREKVFQRFYRLEAHRNSPGHGLGLSLVKAIADSHAGKIELDGDDEGLIFKFSM